MRVGVVIRDALLIVLKHAQNLILCTIIMFFISITIHWQWGILYLTFFFYTANLSCIIYFTIH